MRFAYADPPYPGMAHFYKCPEVDHAALIRDLCEQFPDGWALSTASTTLKMVLPMCPDDVRVAAWVKPWASFKPGVNPAYAWEPVLFRGGRKRDRTERFIGAKPEAFCWWIFDLLGVEKGDEFVDLFVGSGAVTRAWNRWNTERLFA